MLKSLFIEIIEVERDFSEVKNNSNDHIGGVFNLGLKMIINYELSVLDIIANY